jgi:hypothetical protein
VAQVWPTLYADADRETGKHTGTEPVALTDGRIAFQASGNREEVRVYDPVLGTYLTLVMPSGHEPIIMCALPGNRLVTATDPSGPKREQAEDEEEQQQRRRPQGQDEEQQVGTCEELGGWEDCAIVGVFNKRFPGAETPDP